MIGRWMVLLRAAGSSVSGWTAARVFRIASFVGTSAGRWCECCTRVWACTSLAQQGLAALLTLSSTSLALDLGDSAAPLAQPVAGASLAAAVVILGAFRADRLARWLPPPGLQRAAVGQRLLRAARKMARYRTRPHVLAAVFGLSLVVQWLRATEVFLFGAGLSLDVGFGYYLVFMPIALVAFMLQISIEGLGLPQGVITWLLRPAGVPEMQSFALSTLVVVLGLVGTPPGLYLYIRARGGLT